MRHRGTRVPEVYLDQLDQQCIVQVRWLGAAEWLGDSQHTCVSIPYLSCANIVLIGLDKTRERNILGLACETVLKPSICATNFRRGPRAQRLAMLWSY